MQDRFAQLKACLSEWDREAVQAEARLDSLRSVVSTAQDKTEALTDLKRTTASAKAVLEKVSSREAENVQMAVSNLVTSGLQAVFGPFYAFVIEPKIERGRPSVNMFVKVAGRTQDEEEHDSDIVNSHGGGLAAVISFLLRVVVISLEGGKLLIADEPFSHLSAEYVPRMASFLRDLVDQTGIQMILVSHESALAEAADKTYRFVQGPAGVRVE